MAMTEAHKEAIRRGVKKYHAGCRKAMGKESKKPAVKKAVKKPTKTKTLPKKPVVKKAVKKAVKKPSSKKPEIFQDTLPSPPKKKKLTETKILKLEAKNMSNKK